ncbi:MAG: MgtC/SapB family protein [Candidatus Aminicenantes bacterium]|nr:MgtC/SapB family protein [Candidatus Aminicenantes bacterium]
MNIVEITLKLVLAIALGGLIGLERESSQKPAGFRTNILICIGTTMIMVLGSLILQDGNMVGSEISRLAAAAITGIGFIGAGAIIQSRGAVTGLTSAATLWAVAVLGLIIGYGRYPVALVYTGFIYATLAVFRRIEGHFLHKTQNRYTIKTKYPKELLSSIKTIAFHEGLKFQNLSLKSEAGFTVIRFSFHVRGGKEEGFYQTVLELDRISEISID